MLSLQVLVVSMNQKNISIIENSNIKSDVIISNQCSKNEVEIFTKCSKEILMLSFAERGVGLNRNNALMRAKADICVFADDDMKYVDNYEEIITKAFE
ncbi:MAG: glycosyltransferase family A protein [Bacillota bacterium]|nr:glycosyltransferase family A protein [Bacillota bacterium]